LRASVFIATSLDGYIARPDGGLDWLPDAPEDHGYEAFMASVDALVIGRKTFETVQGFGSWPYGAKPVFVLSRTLRSADLPEGAVCEFLPCDPAGAVAALEARGFTHAYVDGGVTITAFLDAGLIQRIILTRIPVLLGAGIPLFGRLRRDIPLRHLDTRAFPSGLVQSTYDVG